MKRCYYEVLGIKAKATTDEIKTAYKKMALKFHPDKNPSDDAKEVFQQINQAYQILSDPNQRTWYDGHKDQILSNKDELSKQDIEMATFGFNIWKYFKGSCFSGYGDDSEGFYAIYREAFSKLIDEEEQAYDILEDDEVEAAYVKPPGFGDSKTDTKQVLNFYNWWESFSTYKTFSWAEQYNPSEGENRYVRRLIEKENKKQRTKEKKEYIQTVKQLVEMARKRDPRYRKIQEERIANQKRKIEQKRLKEIEDKKFKAEMLILKRQEEAKRWEELDKEQRDKKKEQGGSDGEDGDQYEDITTFYCEICNKDFRNENQKKNHENSEKHQQMLKKLVEEVALSDQEEVLKEKFDLKDPETNANDQKSKDQPQNQQQKNQQQNKNKQAANEEGGQDEEEQENSKAEQTETVPETVPETKEAETEQVEETVEEKPKNQKQQKNKDEIAKVDDEDLFASDNQKQKNKKKADNNQNQNNNKNDKGNKKETQKQVQSSDDEKQKSQDEEEEANDQNQDDDDDMDFGAFGSAIGKKNQLVDSDDDQGNNKKKRESKKKINKAQMQEQAAKKRQEEEAKQAKLLKKEAANANSVPSQAPPPPPKAQQQPEPKKEEVQEKSNNHRNFDLPASQQSEEQDRNKVPVQKPSNAQTEEKQQPTNPTTAKPTGGKPETQKEQVLETPDETELNKAKLKKLKKKEKEEKQKEEGVQCQVCNQQFESKTKLFQHISESGHAAIK